MSANDHSESLSLSGLLFTGVEADCGSLEERITQYFFTWREALYRYLYVILRDQSEAEDLTQECFLRLYQELRQQRHIAETKGWLFRTGHNLAVDHYRRRDSHNQGTVDIGEMEIIDERHLSCEESMLHNERIALVRAAADKLPQQQRLCLQLRTEGFRYREIAEILSVSESTVSEGIRRALIRLMKDLHDQ
jgi:RNA polymerase sigma-70 factor (ECF subfamily)